MTKAPLVFLFDVDNTLLNNDRVTQDLSTELDKQFGIARRERYFVIFEELRARLGYTDYLGALQQYRIEYPTDPHLLEASTFLIDYPFSDRLYPSALDAIEYVRQFGQPAILSDGDVVFQPRKVHRSGIAAAVRGNVLIYIHKEEMLDDVEARYPAEHYCLVDDKLRILTEVKKRWGKKVTTIFPRQGHYALDAKEIARYPAADVTVERIGDLMGMGSEAFGGG